MRLYSTGPSTGYSSGRRDTPSAPMTSQPTTRAELRRALDDNFYEQADPAVRIRRAEHLVDAATQLGDPPLLILALLDLIAALRSSSRNHRILVPFARALKMWDDNPADFDTYDARR